MCRSYNRVCVVLMAILTAIGKVGQSASDVPTAETRANANRLGNKIFIALGACAQLRGLSLRFGKSSVQTML